MHPFVLPITAAYTAINVILLIGLALLVVHHRTANQVALGSGGVEALERAIRTHGNLAEFAPSALILLALLELNSLPGWQLLVLGGLFTVSRLSHIHGMLTATLLTRAMGALLSVIIMLSMIGRLGTMALFE
jgi:hypothetical protein